MTRSIFRAEGPWSASELTQLAAADVAGVVGQDPDHPLMPQYAASLRDVGELLTHGSPEEVELRACAATAGRRSPAEIDAALWNRGRGKRYKATPRPRSRNTAY